MLHVFEHIVHGAVCEYIVRDDAGRNVRIFNASARGRAAAYAMVAAHNG